MQARRRVKTDAIDLEAITELVLPGHGCRSRLVATITELTGRAMTAAGESGADATELLLAQLDRCFPG